jgi:dipeptidyl aminopeptidase/acylaminoacyl peptidase
MPPHHLRPRRWRQGESHPVPNPAGFPKGAQQQLWVVSAEGGEPRLLAEGHARDVPGRQATGLHVLKGQIWLLHLDDPKGQARATAANARLCGKGLCAGLPTARARFVSDRGDHSFVALYSAASGSVTYLDPSTDLDSNPVWSPDSTRIAFLRIPPDKDSLLFEPHRTALPWSIRVVEVTTGKAHEVWRAAEGAGSAYRETDSLEQLHWTAGDRIVFPWERDGWLHLFAVPVSGGTATPLTPGNFEVEHVSLSGDRKMLVFDSNQNDIDRRHVWRIIFAADGSNHAAEAVTAGDGIETQPVVASDGVTVAVALRCRLPMRAAVVESGHLVDLAPQAIPADYPAARLVIPRQVIFPAADGLEIHGQLFVPEGIAPGERRPAMVFFHGGSQRQMLLGWHYMEYYSNAYAMNQYLASLGYIVLSVNYRSGIGYGLNFREALNYGATGASEFNDVLGAGLYLKRPARRGWNTHRLVGRQLRRLSDCAGAGPSLRSVFRRR